MLCTTVGGLLIASALSGCGGSGDDDSSTQIRLINASAGYSSLNLTWDDSTVASAVSPGTASSYTGVSSGTEDTTITTSDSATALVTTSRSLSSDTSYSVVAYGWKGALKTSVLTDDEDAADSGYAKFRIFNTATDAGTLDVYLTGTDTALSDSTPVASAVEAGAFNSAGYLKVKKGAWRLRVTGTGSTTDLRLDVSSLTLSDTQVYTLILSPTTGGVMVNSILAQQGSTVTAYDTGLARARLVAAVTNTTTPTVSAVVGGTTLSTGTSSPSVGSYQIVTAGSGRTLDLKVNGTALSSTSVDITAGTEVSLLVAGDPSAATLTTLTDDNRLPSSGYAKMRLVNASWGTGDLFLTVDYASLASNIGYGVASDYSTIVATGSTENTVQISSASGTVYSPSAVYLQSKGVYSAFLLGSSTSQSGRLSKDR